MSCAVCRCTCSADSFLLDVFAAKVVRKLLRSAVAPNGKVDIVGDDATINSEKQYHCTFCWLWQVLCPLAVFLLLLQICLLCAYADSRRNILPASIVIPMVLAGCSVAMAKRACSAHRHERQAELRRFGWSLAFVVLFGACRVSCPLLLFDPQLILRVCFCIDTELGIFVIHAAAVRKPELALELIKGWGPLPDLNSATRSMRMLASTLHMVSSSSRTTGRVLARAGLIDLLVGFLDANIEDDITKDAMAALMNIGAGSIQLALQLTHAGVLERVVAFLQKKDVSSEIRFYAVGSLAALLSVSAQCKKVGHESWKVLAMVIPELASWLQSDNLMQQLFSSSALFASGQCNKKLLKLWVKSRVPAALKQILKAPSSALPDTWLYAKRSLKMFRSSRRSASRVKWTSGSIAMHPVVVT